MKNDPINYSEYNQWANQVILDTINLLSEEQYWHDTGLKPFSTIHAILLHTLEYEVKEMSPYFNFPFDKSFVKTKDELLNNFKNFLKELNNTGAIDKNVILKILAHSSYHRGQLFVLLSQLNIPVVSTDVYMFQSK